MLVVVQLLFSALPATAQVNIDGGRSELPGMKQDMFDRAQKSKKSGPQSRGRGPPECPKSDKMSPFFGMAFVSGELYVKVNSSDSQCSKLITAGGANYTVLSNASRTCGPAGEWKKRIAEELSAVFFQGGLEWVKNENETIEVMTEDGTFDAMVSEEKYKEQSECWARGCGCEQAKNPVGRGILVSLLVISVGGLVFDSLRLSWEKIRGKKPAKHVQCKKGHRMEEVKFVKTHVCDVCGKQGTCYQCGISCPYDMCKLCYKAAKKKLKTDLEEWYAKHPGDKQKDEEKKKDKKKKDEKEDSDDDDAKKDANTQSEAESTTKAESEGKAESKAESSKPEDDDEAEEREKVALETEGGETGAAAEAEGTEDNSELQQAPAEQQVKEEDS